MGDCVDKRANLLKYGFTEWNYKLKRDFKEKRGANSKCFQFKNATNYWRSTRTDSKADTYGFGNSTSFPVCYEHKCNADGTVSVTVG